MEMLREGIGLRGYGQRDPLVEYKRESFNMFQRLLRMVEADLVNLIYKVEIIKQPSPMEGQQEMRGSMPVPPEGMKNQESQAGNQPAQSNKSKVGRNDPCPCGSGKKYKKCCGK